MDDSPVTFRATLVPHRSLPASGFLILMVALVTINLAAGLAFYLLGAWPVAGFMGLDVALVWWAFRKNYASANIAERIEISEHELVLERLEQGKAREERRFTRGWVQVELEEDETRELIGGLYLRSRGIRTEIGRFLSAEERKAFCATLRSALAKPRI